MPRGGVVVRVWCGCALRTFDISLRDTSHMGHSFGATSFAIGSSHIGFASPWVDEYSGNLFGP